MAEIGYLSASEQEDYAHFIFCKHNMSEVYKILLEIKESQQHQLVKFAFGYALVRYASVYHKSQTNTGRRLHLATDHIPKEFIQLHKEIMRERDKLHAHFDLSYVNPRLLNIEELNGQLNAIFLHNVILPFDKIRLLPDILALIKGTMDNLQKETERREEVIMQKSQKRPVDRYPKVQ